MRKLRIFQENSYVTVDFMEGAVETYRVVETIPENEPFDMMVDIEGAKKRHILYHKPPVTPGNALRIELAHFADSIINSEIPLVDGHSATEALTLAVRIQNIIDSDIK